MLPEFNSEQSDSKSIREEFEKQLPCDRSKDISKSMLKVNSKIPSGSKTKGSSKKQLMQKGKRDNVRCLHNIVRLTFLNWEVCFLFVQ